MAAGPNEGRSRVVGLCRPRGVLWRGRTAGSVDLWSTCRGVATSRDPASSRACATSDQAVASLNGSGDGDCAPPPFHTTGRAVFRIRRLNAAALASGRKIRGKGPRMLVHRFLSEVSQNLRLGSAAWDPPRFHRFCPSRSIRVATAVVVPSDFRTCQFWQEMDYVGTHGCGSDSCHGAHPLLAARFSLLAPPTPELS